MPKMNAAKMRRLEARQKEVHYMDFRQPETEVKNPTYIVLPRKKVKNTGSTNGVGRVFTTSHDMRACREVVNQKRRMKLQPSKYGCNGNRTPSIKKLCLKYGFTKDEGRAIVIDCIKQVLSDAIMKKQFASRHEYMLIANELEKMGMYIPDNSDACITIIKKNIVNTFINNIKKMNIDIYKY